MSRVFDQRTFNTQRHVSKLRLATTARSGSASLLLHARAAALLRPAGPDCRVLRARTHVRGDVMASELLGTLVEVLLLEVSHTKACTRPDPHHVRCTMTIKDGTGVSSTVRMRLTRGKLL